jgi:hypothetical protein
MPRWVNLALPLVTLASYVLLAGIFGPRISAAAGGLLPFDLRALGYDAGAARAFLTALTPEGRDLYLGPVRVNDTVFPILFTLTLCLPLRGWGWLWFLPALAYGLLDLAENMAVAVLLSAGPEVAAGQVALASGLTMAKFAAAVLAIVLALVALVAKWRAR